MNESEILNVFREAGAFLEGHFLLTSGLHSPVYVEKFKLLQYPQYVDLLAGEMIQRCGNEEIDVVVGPAVGGIILAYEVARKLGVRMAFTEREGDRMSFRRDFTLNVTDRVLVVEDVVTTGGSLEEVLSGVEAIGAAPRAIAALVDRSGGKVSFRYPFHSLLQMQVQTYRPEECPLCREEVNLQKRGSRKMKG